MSAAPARPRGAGRDGGGRGRFRPARAIQYALLALVVVVMDAPLAWMVLSSLKPDAENAAYPPTLLPRTWTLQEYVSLFKVSDYGTYLGNSLFLAVGATAAALVLATLAGYVLTRFRLPLLQPIGEIALFAYLIPPILLLVPIARLVAFAGLANDRLALLIIYTANLLPFGLWVLRAHFQGIAADLEDAAMIDGCSRFGAFGRVIIPQAVPGLIAAGVFTFNASWSEYLYASTLLNSPDKLTLSPGLALLMDQTGVYSWGVLMAGSVIMVVPLILLFALAQQQLVGGRGEGAIKG
jgi:multiple sugar transport system permease protein